MTIDQELGLGLAFPELSDSGEIPGVLVGRGGGGSISVSILEEEDSPGLFGLAGGRCERVIAQVVSLSSCESESWRYPVMSEGGEGEEPWRYPVVSLERGEDTVGAFSAQCLR